MGRDKATLPFGPDETILPRVVRLVGEVVPFGRIVCAAAVDQSLPVLPAGVRIAVDRQSGRGPLAGLAAGLEARCRGRRPPFLSRAATCHCWCRPS